MKKVFIVMLVTGLLAMTSLAFAGGDKVRGDKGEGATSTLHHTDDAPGTELPGWWQ